MAILPTKDAIVRFDENEDRLNTFINSYGTYSPNSGLPNVETLPSFMQRLDSLTAQNISALNLLTATNVKGAWTTSTSYSVWDEVQYSGTWYRCVVAHISTSTFDSSKWRISQGVSSGQLSSGSGASLVGYSDTTVEDMLNAINLPDYAALDAYVGKSKHVYITGYLVTATPSGVAGHFVRDDHDTTTPANPGTVRVDALNRRWKRQFSGAINVLWFGAKRDGSNDSPAIQAAIDYAKPSLLAVYAPAGRYYLGSPVTADYPLTMFGDGGQGYSKPLASATLHQGTVFVSGVTTGNALSVAPPTFSNGLSLRNFTLTGKEGVSTDSGLYLHNVGWTGVIENVTLDNFGGSNLVVDYIQDTYFNNVSLLRGGATLAKPLLKFTGSSNYVYFNGCHIEDANYLLTSSGSAWEVHFNQCHFESGDYGGALGQAYEHRYSSSPIAATGSEYNWSFQDCTFVPVNVDALVTANGGSRSTQPYYVNLGNNAKRFKFAECRWIAPSGAIDPIFAGGSYNKHSLVNCNFDSVNPAKYSIAFGDCSIIGGDISFYEGWNIPTLYGVSVDRGVIAGLTFANNGGGTAKTAGYLIFSNVDNGLKLSGNRYELGTFPFKWASTYVNVSQETDDAGWFNYTSSGSIDMETVPLGYGLRTTTAGLAITGMPNCQRGRKVKIFNNSGSGTVNFVANQVFPKTANNLSMAAYSQYLFLADSTGMLVQVTS